MNLGLYLYPWVLWYFKQSWIDFEFILWSIKKCSWGMRFYFLWPVLSQKYIKFGIAFSNIVPISGICGVLLVSQPDVIFPTPHTVCDSVDAMVTNISSKDNTTLTHDNIDHETNCPKRHKEWVGYILTLVTGFTNTIRNALIRKFFCKDGDISWTFWASIGSILLSGKGWSICTFFLKWTMFIYQS